MKAELVDYNQAPRKVRLVTELIKGKTVEKALDALTFFPKRAAEPIRKLIMSAAANAKQLGVEDPMKLKVKNIEVNSSGMLTRFRARAMGRSATIRHRKSRVAVTLA
jgi:large subunit ribosomal protein L22